jgi:bacterioferritin
MENEAWIELLRKDMMGEHQAIIQYLRHAYLMGLEGIPAEIEAIARDEMRHFDWLADAIVELGGEPTLKRDPVDLSQAPAAEQLRKDVGLEETAIVQYRAHMEAITDPKIRRLLARIVEDELRHKEIFEGLVAEAQAAPEPAPTQAAELAKPPKRLAEILNQGIRHEYTVILQYLYHSFVAKDKELAETMQDSAINEMQHMGWLSESLAERGGDPDMSHTELALTKDPVEMLEADIAVEREVTKDYTSQMTEVEEPEVKELLGYIRDHEVYHDAVFSDLLEEAKQEGEPTQAPEKPEPPKTIPSVGSLKGEK